MVTSVFMTLFKHPKIRIFALRALVIKTSFYNYVYHLNSLISRVLRC